jgi:hypothetical protein
MGFKIWCKMRGLSVRLKSKGLICNWISNYKVLGVKSVKEFDCGLVSGKVMGLIAKCLGKSIIGRIIFLKKTLWTESRVRGPREMASVHGPWWTGLHTPLPTSNLGPPIRIRRPEEEEAEQRQPRAAQPGCAVAQPPESHWNGTSVAGGSLRAADERKRRSANLMAALERSKEAKSELAMERSGWLC